MKKPFFTVIIPMYNVEKYIGECLESLIKQTFSSYEIIIIDDCSADNSYDCALQYITKCNKLRIYRHKCNKGPGGARNTGLKFAKGDYITFVDSDDFVEPNFLEVIHRIINEQQEPECIWYNGYYYNDNTKEASKNAIFPKKDGFITITPENINLFSDLTLKVYKAKTLIESKIRYPEYVTYEDGEFYYKYFAVHNKVFTTSQCLYNYRTHRCGSITTNMNNGICSVKDVVSVVKNIQNFYIERDIFEEYKYPLIKLITTRLNILYKRHFNKDKTNCAEMLNVINNLSALLQHIKDNEQQDPMFSVIVPFYNVEQYIKQCLTSIQKQTFPSLEIICVDDCGSDGSLEIVQELMRYDKRIKLIRHKKNKGLGAARNTGLKASLGRYVLFVDSDDWIDENCLQEVYSKFKNGKYDTIWFKVNLWLENQQKMTDWYNFSYYRTLQEGVLEISDDNLALLPSSAWNKAYKRDFLITNKIKFTENVFFEDVEFYFKTATKSPTAYVINKPFYFYRKRENSILYNCVRDKNKAKHVYKVAKGVHKYLVDSNYIKQYRKSAYSFALTITKEYAAFPELQNSLKKEILDYINFVTSYGNAHFKYDI